jgi:hypothetical protein
MVTGFVACGMIRFGDVGADLKRAIEVDKVPSSHYNWLRCLRNNKVGIYQCVVNSATEVDKVPSSH